MNVAQATKKRKFAHSPTDDNSGFFNYLYGWEFVPKIRAQGRPTSACGGKPPNLALEFGAKPPKKDHNTRAKQKIL